ncbi:RidA family protein [Maridesulfovibrio ferrireducens]|uniref:Endoribonuclease L-PSP n=1 Tax=Maridesulfovibrio ferrireducens TaxID=246191 RepID=A0A1G9AV00_9BACT|nr:RidA family protein [Maridesulfovibrio ferrireducens]MBI9109757.1 RidA family protein [Maridesulfovibrio ferrireducens]SDK30734.1 endoribonuclease L-PSP [Maridesulfovibrio ferrireducens]
MSNKKAIETSNAPGAIGPYSQGVVAGNLLFASGQLPINPETGKMVEGSIEDRAHQVFKNLCAIVEAAGGNADGVVKTTVFLTDLADFQAVNAVYSEYFKAPFPARSAIQVAGLPLGSDIEMEAIISL